MNLCECAVCLQCVVGFVQLFSFACALTSKPAHQPFDRSACFTCFTRISRLKIGHLLALFCSARTKCEIFRHLLYRTEYFIFKSKFCFNLSKSSHSSMCVLNLALNYFQATYSAQLSKSSDFFPMHVAVAEAEGVGIAPFWMNFVWTELILTTFNINEEKIVAAATSTTRKREHAACCQSEGRKERKQRKNNQIKIDLNSTRQISLSSIKALYMLNSNPFRSF